MAARLRANRVAFRRAIFASVAIHIVLAVVIILVLRAQPNSQPLAPGIDTGLDVVVHTFEVGPPNDVAVASPLEPIASEPIVEPPVATPMAETGLAPRTNIVPRALSAEVLAVIGRSVAARHVAGASPIATVSAIHGALKPGQTIVYVLDSSGSMGESGKLALARSALLATLHEQPEGVRFQVIVYGSTARPLLAGNACVPVDRANIETAESKLATLEAKGRSNHVEAVRLAMGCRPDLILLLTDAEDLSLAQFKPFLASAPKPVAIRVAKVTASAVGPPQELR